MERININLLPEEFLVERGKKVKFLQIQALGVAVLLFFIFLSSLTVALRILQSRNINLIQSQLGTAEQKITQEKGKQASLLIVKDRLTAINQYLEVSSKQAAIYKLIVNLLPPGILLSSISIDRAGDANLLTSVSDVDTLDNLISSLLNSELNEQKIAQIEIENLSRGRDGVFRVGLKIKSNLK